MNTDSNRTILFITGAFISHTCWDNWRNYFEERDYTTLAPPWPGKDASPEILRQRHPDSEVAAIRLKDLIAHYEAICDRLPQKPIVIGHSLGGLIAQILASKGKAQLAVGLHSVPPKGIFTYKFSFYKAGWGALGFFTSVKRTFMMSLDQWRYAFTNGMPEEWQESSYFTYAIPESKLAVRDTIGPDAVVDFKAPHAPLLLIAGEIDHAIPSSLNKSNYEAYQNRESITDFREFPGRNHFVIGQPGWEEITQYISEWLRINTDHKTRTDNVSNSF
ncbi:alpha/beta hydrolase [Flavobacterium silvaticum]|uniref:Alpha/beta hydrolase n=1 Tax=Flavobacterium silvaticum TaxID=1852020 RepID=A0A972JGW8_9FLAO|nr:alpha/beta hydrolase [Flavobacterium silvaticum]NMH28631.1 alpha/beta hydrolase [Flavobacterium silvaticum]